MNTIHNLSEQEINEILENYEKTKKAEMVIEAYKNNCPNFKDGKCAGSVSINSRSGCNLCIKEGKHDLNNAKPPMSSKWEYVEFEKEKTALLLETVRNCKLAFDDNFCRYKDIFNYCAFCSKEFRRKER